MTQEVSIDVTLILEDGPINASAMREIVRFFLQDARRDGQITPEDELDHAMLTDFKVELIQPGLETPRMLVLSTAHITAQTATNLQSLMSQGRTAAVREYLNLPIVFEKGEYGYLLPMIPFESGDADDRDRWDSYPDLLVIRSLAIANGCTWIMLDQDADVIDALPSYDW